MNTTGILGGSYSRNVTDYDYPTEASDAEISNLLTHLTALVTSYEVNRNELAARISSVCSQHPHPAKDVKEAALPQQRTKLGSVLYGLIQHIGRGNQDLENLTRSVEL